MNHPSVRAVLLAGHSNSGKTPVGDELTRELSDSTRHAYHLDFGYLLRHTCARDIDPGFDAPTLHLIEAFMHGRLLDDSSFHVAEQLVRWYLKQREFEAAHDVLILNGIPRSVTQASRIAGIGVDIRVVVHLDCSVATAWQRKLRSESGTGFEDRRDRDDHSREVFERKARSFLTDTMPLLEHYRDTGTFVYHLPIEVGTSPEQAAAEVRSIVLRRTERARAPGETPA